MVYLWIALIAVFSIVESFTMQLVGIWFAGGALAAAIAELFGATNAIQIIIFFAVSVILLITTRPLAKRFIKTDDRKTNLDSLIGKEVKISEEVDNILETGKTSINGVSWTVRSASGSKIEKDAVCVVEKIEGVKLIVTEKERND